MKVLLLSQAPCTAGTFITSFICQHLEPDYLVGESNPWSLYFSTSRQDFTPLYPPFFSAASGLLDEDSHLEIFSASMDKFLEIADSKSCNLIVVRDHLYSEFFVADKFRQKNPYWVQYFASRELDFRVIFTVRHPLDSYLGFKKSFPNQAKEFTLESYSECYANAYRSYVSSCNLSILSIENLAERTEGHELINDLKNWAQRIGRSENVVPSLSPWISSGASGRFSTTPVHFTRRLYGSSIRQEVISSSSFSSLCKLLGYRFSPNEFCDLQSILLSRFVDIYGHIFFPPIMEPLLFRCGLSKPIL